jgi:hypothetical protein
MGSLTNWRGAGLTLAPLFTFWYNEQGDDMRRIVSNRVTKEERVAIQLGKLLTDFHLDLESIGYYMAKANPTLVYRRFIEVAESAQHQKEAVDYIEMEQYNERLF